MRSKFAGGRVIASPSLPMTKTQTRRSEIAKKGVRMKDLPRLAPAFYKSVFSDLTALVSFHKEDNRRSALYLLKRIEKEGLSVISRSLPELGKAVEVALITGTKVSVPQTFSLHWRSKLPNFMHSYFVQLFDSTGMPRYLARELYAQSDAVFAFWAIRQITLAFSKARDLGCLVSDDEALKSFTSRISAQAEITAPSWLLNRARQLLKAVIGDDDRLDPSLEQ